MDFKRLNKDQEGYVYNPYAAKIDGVWVEGSIDPSFLNENYGKYDTAEEMKTATDSEGLKLFFNDLKEKGIID